MSGPSKKLKKPVDFPALAAQGARLLHSLGGSFALIGGGAMQAYGLERSTKDVDFAVREQLGAKAAAAWRAQGRKVVELRIGGNALETDDATIDLIDRRFELRTLFEEAIDAAARSGNVVQAEDQEIPVVPLEYLIAMKLAAVRPIDEADLAFLLSLPDLKYNDAREVVGRLLGPVTARFLDRAARLAGRTDVRPDYDEYDRGRRLVEGVRLVAPPIGDGEGDEEEGDTVLGGFFRDFPGLPETLRRGGTRRS